MRLLLLLLASHAVHLIPGLFSAVLPRFSSRQLSIGLSYEDSVRNGILVSSQKPLGIILEECKHRPRRSAAPRMQSDEVTLIDRSLQAARACSLAFVPPASMQFEPYAKGLECVAQVEDPISQAGATIFNAEGQLLIACRGSASVKNFQTNLNIGPVPLSIGSKPEGALVHTGFQQAAKELWRLIEAELPPSELPVLVTGHSLGGGTATLLALHLAAAGREAQLLTVAGPRLGNAEFAKHYRTCCPPAVHLVHDDDDVLASNTKLWDDLGFEHVGSLMRCSKDTACVYEADDEMRLPERPSRSGPPSLKGVFVDHCQYLGLYIGLRLEQPSVWLRLPW